MLRLYCVLLNNFMQVKCNRDLNTYEERCYQQILVTIKTKARIDELVLQRAVEEVKDGKGDHQASGESPQQDPELEEYRGDDPETAV